MHKKQLFSYFIDPKAIKFVSRINTWNFWGILNFFYGFKVFVTIKSFLEFFIWLFRVTAFPTTSANSCKYRKQVFWKTVQLLFWKVVTVKAVTIFHSHIIGEEYVNLVLGHRSQEQFETHDKTHEIAAIYILMKDKCPSENKCLTLLTGRAILCLIFKEKKMFSVF